MPVIQFKREGGILAETYAVLDDSGHVITKLNFPFTISATIGNFEFDDKHFQIVKKFWSQHILKCEEEIVATASSDLGFFKTEIAIMMLSRQFTIRDGGFQIARRKMELLENELLLGTFDQISFWSNRVCATISDEIPVPESIYLAWIVEQMWSGHAHIVSAS